MNVKTMLAQFVVKAGGRSRNVMLNGVGYGDRLTTDIARRCVEVATGSREEPATVWETSDAGVNDDELVGYHVTPSGCRKFWVIDVEG